MAVHVDFVGRFPAKAHVCALCARDTVLQSAYLWCTLSNMCVCVLARVCVFACVFVSLHVCVCVSAHCIYVYVRAHLSMAHVV
jgi:hypothetical protein